jgi:repressor of nif and glnA expression
MIAEILQAAAPRALPPAAIRKALQEKGVNLAFTSIRHALGKLEARKAARQVGNSRTWRYSAAG